MFVLRPWSVQQTRLTSPNRNEADRTLSDSPRDNPSVMQTYTILLTNITNIMLVNGGSVGTTYKDIMLKLYLRLGRTIPERILLFTNT